MALRLFARAAQVSRRPAARSFATGQDAVVSLYLQELAKITAKADTGPDPELVKSMEGLKQKSLGEISSAVADADAETLAVIKDMPAWVDADVLAAEYKKLKSAAPAFSPPSPYYPPAAAALATKATNQKMLFEAYKNVA